MGERQTERGTFCITPARADVPDFAPAVQNLLPHWIRGGKL